MLTVDRSKTTREELIQRYRSCKNSRLAQRIHCILLSYDRKTPPEIAKLLYRNVATIREWIIAFNESGFEGLESEKPPGRPEGFDDGQLGEIKKAVSNSPRESGYKFSNWTCKLVGSFIQHNFRIRYSVERVRQILRKIGFRMVRERYQYILANPKEQESFLSEFAETVENLEDDQVILFEDECSVQQHPTLSSRWALREQRGIPTYGSHKKKHLFGFVSPFEGHFNYHSSDSLRADEFKKGIKRIRGHYPRKRVILYVDNATHHTAKSLRGFLEAQRGWLDLRFMPKYSPELNPVERIWKLLRRDVTHNTLFSSMKELVSAIRSFLHRISRAPEELMKTCAIKVQVF